MHCSAYIPGQARLNAYIKDTNLGCVYIHACDTAVSFYDVNEYWTQLAINC